MLFLARKYENKGGFAPRPMLLINLLVIVLLIALTGFFVTTEFAIVKVWTSRIEHGWLNGKEVAEIRKITANHSRRCQLIYSGCKSVTRNHFSAKEVDTIGGWFLLQNSNVQVVVCAEVEAEGDVFKLHELMDITSQ